MSNVGIEVTNSNGIGRHNNKHITQMLAECTLFADPDREFCVTFWSSDERNDASQCDTAKVVLYDDEASTEITGEMYFVARIEEYINDDLDNPVRVGKVYFYNF